jgi:hypothetical protein
MTMKLPKITVKLFVALAAVCCLLPALSAQTAPAVKTARKPKAKVSAPAPKAAAAANAPADGAAPAAEKLGVLVARRDPFSPLINEKKESGNIDHLPPGKAGLVIGSVHVDGTVRSSDGMIAVLSNPDEHVYFVHEGDRLYDGDVEKIGLDGVTFRQNSKDAFGKLVERVVTKRIYASAGEQQ